MNNDNNSRRYLNDFYLLAAVFLISIILVFGRKLLVNDGDYVHISYTNRYGDKETLDLALNQDRSVIFLFDYMNQLIEYQDIDQSESALLEISDSDDYEYNDSDIAGFNVLLIKDGHVCISEASCPDLVCVHTKIATRNGDSIICLPHKLFITITGELENDGAVDAITW